jgi:predicted nucleotidyltransferase
MRYRWQGVVQVRRGAAGRMIAYVRRTLAAAALPDVAAVYLFGSCCRGEPRPDSDIDLAIVPLPDVWERPGWAPWHLEADVARLLRPLDGHPFDVSVLSPRNVRFAFEVIRTGRRVLCPDPEAADAFAERVVRRFPEEEYRFRRALADALPEVEVRP